jgi:hypothetical protein
VIPCCHVCGRSARLVPIFWEPSKKRHVCHWDLLKEKEAALERQHMERVNQRGYQRQGRGRWLPTEAA